MKNFLLKLILRNFFTPEIYEEQKMKDWFFESKANRGYASYYTLRKKTITNLMGNGITWNDYLICVGRLQELRALNENIDKEFKMRSKNVKKKVTKKS